VSERVDLAQVSSLMGRLVPGATEILLPALLERQGQVALEHA